MSARVKPARLPRLVSVATANPPRCWPQAETEDIMMQLWQLKGVACDRWRRIVAGSCIDTRRAVRTLQEVVHLTTAQRMEAYELCAPPLAAAAAKEAMERAGVHAQDITDLIVVSCTGFSAPGLDVALIEALRLRSTTRRTLIGFMGCFGAISGLRSAVGACSADAKAVALVVCLELCSLHMRLDRSAQNQVASALFADGAAAAVVAGSRAIDPSNGGASREIGCLTPGASQLMPDGRDWMTWKITDAGFAMTLTRDVPLALREGLRGFVESAYAWRPQTFIIHPGGPGILEAADEALGLNGSHGLQSSREILRRFGNMSSATVLYVLERAQQSELRLPALLLAFGPGLTIESMPIVPSR